MSIVAVDNWAPNPEEMKRGMSLKTVQRAGSKNGRSASTGGAAAGRTPCSLTTEGLALKATSSVSSVVERPVISLVNQDKEIRAAKQAEAAKREAAYAKKDIDPESKEAFTRGTNNTNGIDGARPRTAASGSSTFHHPKGTAKDSTSYRPEECKRDPLNPSYALPTKKVAPGISKTDFSDPEHQAAQPIVRPSTAGGEGAATRRHPWDVSREEYQPVCKLVIAKKINGPPRQVTKLKPKTTDKASGYLDYSDIARSTNRWYIDLQEKRASGKKQLGLATADVNEKKSHWNERFVDGKLVVREGNPLTPRYTHDGEPYGEIDKNIRTGFRHWKTNRGKSMIETTLDIEGAQPTAHGMPKSVASHRGQYGEPREAVLATTKGMRDSQLRRYENNDIFGSESQNKSAVALGGTAAAYGLPFKTESQLQYQGKQQTRANSAQAKGRGATTGETVVVPPPPRPAGSAAAAQQEIADQWNIIHLSAKHTKAGANTTGAHPSCTFSKELSGGRQTNPVMPMYNYSRSPTKVNHAKIQSEGKSWDPSHERLERSAGDAASQKIGFRTDEDKKAREQTLLSVDKFQKRLDGLAKASKVTKLKDDVALVRSLPQPSAPDA